MGINIKNESQQLINNFNEVNGDDKTKAMVVMSTNLEAEHEGDLLLSCSGTGSKLLNIQLTSLVKTFSHLIENGSIKNPQIEIVKLLASLNESLSLEASGADHGKS